MFEALGDWVARRSPSDWLSESSVGLVCEVDRSEVWSRESVGSLRCLSYRTVSQQLVLWKV